MILQSLHDYYRRKHLDPDVSRRLPSFGYEEKEIPFILEIAPDGRLTGIEDTRTGSGKAQAAARFLVPKGVKKTSGIAANLLWDTAEYVLGAADGKKQSEAQRAGRAAEYGQRLREMQSAFKARLAGLPPGARHDEGIQAVLAFLEAEAGKRLSGHAAAAEIAQTNPILSFRLVGDDELICQRPAVASARRTDQLADQPTNAASPTGICLVTGELAAIERLHTAIKGVWGAQSSGANIVSFNLKAFNSYGLERGANAPISKEAAFAYTSALNHLLHRRSRQRVQVGDASTIFWAQRQSSAVFEEWFAELFKESDDPDGRTGRLRALYSAARAGRFAGTPGNDPFFVLGLAPNAARIAVRFWHVAPVSEIAQRTCDWFDDLRIVRGPKDAEFPALFSLLLSTAVLSKAVNIPPNLGGDVMRSMLNGGPLPTSLLQAVVQRCRADQARKSETGKPVMNVSYARAALMKACLNRLIRHERFEGKEVSVSLDNQNAEPAYLSGRLFSAYERVQFDVAGRELNGSLRDTYFGSAMSNPASVFPRLIQLNEHRMRDLRRSAPGLHKLRDRLIGEIWNKLDADVKWPASQPLAGRALFALGYYHQRQAFFTSAPTIASANEASIASDQEPQ